jgi:hypothetical protein
VCDGVVFISIHSEIMLNWTSVTDHGFPRNRADGKFISPAVKLYTFHAQHHVTCTDMPCALFGHGTRIFAH